MNLYVSNLGEHITDESLRAVFATHGNVSSSKIERHQVTGASKGFGFIDMPNNAEALNAIKKINGVVINGRKVSVKATTSRLS